MDSKLQQMLMKPLLAGGAVYLISAMTDGNTQVGFAGKTFSKAMADGVVTVGASMLSDVAGSYILPNISHDQKLAHLESSLLHPVLTGSALVGLEEVLVRGSVARYGFLKPFAKGSVGEIVGLYAYQALHDKKLY